MDVSARPSRIMFVSTALTLGGGAEGALARLVMAEPRLADEIIVVSLLPGDAHVERMRRAGVNVVELGFDRLGGIVTGLFRLARMIARTKPDIVEGWMYHGDLAALLALAISGRRKQTRLIWSIRCSDMALGDYGIGLRAVVKACVALSRMPDVVTANSTAGMNEHLALGYRPRRTEIIDNGIDSNEFKPDAAARAAVRRDLGIASDAIVIAHVARADPMKDHQTFLAAMAQLPGLQALMIGRGPETLPGAPHIHRLGRRADVARLLAAADIVVSSSAYGEGFSNAIAEGMSCGLPAVATDVGDAARIVGDTGIIVAPRDDKALAAALRRLANESPAERARRGAAARERIATHFSLDRAVAGFRGLYERILRMDPAAHSATDSTRMGASF
ncbi:MAG: glycosyltransferase [Xanthobacteraceae bacterium]